MEVCSFNQLVNLKFWTLNWPRIRIKCYRFVQRLKTWDLRKFENINKIPKLSWIYGLVLSPPPKIKNLSVLAKISRKTEIELCHSALFHLKTRVCLKFFVNHCLWKQFLDSKLPYRTSSLICFIIFVNLRPMTQF